MTNSETLVGPLPGRPAIARYVEHVMNMPISLALRGRHTNDQAARSAWSAVMAELHEVDRVFSTYRADTYISRLARGEITVPECPPEVAEVLDLGDRAEQESAGAFSVWRPGPDGEFGFDPTGVVKGWAVERAAAPLRDLPETDFCLSAGGDMTCQTVTQAAEPWRIGVEDPTDPTRIVAVIPIFTGAVATSGTAHRGQHLIDARTGRPPTEIASVTVVAESLTWADIDATAAYVQGRQAVRWLETRPARSALVVWADGRTTTIQA
jgi:thiamine biosynthesis lipoprotein